MIFPLNEKLYSSNLSRGHQLRVHLQGIGYPIHNDVQYGGIYNKAEASTRKAASIQAIQNVSLQKETMCADPSVTDIDKKGAKESSLCTQGVVGIEKHFSAAQLNAYGHSIDLHALKYKITFSGKMKGKRKKVGSNDELDNREVTVIEFETKEPTWSCLHGNVDAKWL